MNAARYLYKVETRQRPLTVQAMAQFGRTDMPEQPR